MVFLHTTSCCCIIMYEINNINYYYQKKMAAGVTRMVCQKNPPKVQNMVWPTIQLHGRQIHDNVVSITLVHSMTGHSVVVYHTM